MLPALVKFEIKVRDSIVLFKTFDLGFLANIPDFIQHLHANSQR